MSKARKASSRRKIQRGILRGIWNDTMKRMDFFTRSSKGDFIIASPDGQMRGQGPGLAGPQLDRMQAKNQ